MRPIKTTIWITGYAGALGQHVVAEVQRRCPFALVLGLGRGKRGPTDVAQGPGLECINGTLGSDLFDIARQTYGLPDLVFHLAAGSSVGCSIDHPERDFQKSVDGTAALYHWLGRASPNTRVLATSSAAVYGAGHSDPIAETASLTPASPYGWHKKMCEDLAAAAHQRFGLCVRPLRVFSLFGTGLRKQLFWDLARRATSAPQEITLAGSGREWRDWSPLSEVARVLVDLSQATHVFKEAPAALNICSGQGTEIIVAAGQFLNALFHPSIRPPSLRFSLSERTGDPVALVGNTDALVDLGIKPPAPWPVGLADAAMWYGKESGFAESSLYPAVRKAMDGRANIPSQHRANVLGGHPIPPSSPGVLRQSRTAAAFRAAH